MKIVYRRLSFWVTDRLALFFSFMRIFYLVMPRLCYFCQKTKVTQPRHDKVNLVHKPKKTKQACQHNKKEEADAYFSHVRQPYLVSIESLI